MEQQSDNDDGLVWAVIDSGTRRLVGRTTKHATPGSVLTVHDAVELDTTVTRLPSPTGQLANLYSPSMIPVDVEEDVVDIDCVISNIRFFSGMKDKGRRYHQMYESLMDQIKQSRAKAAGITLEKSMPGAPGGGMPSRGPIRG